jgi:hypothetical protein
VSSHAKASSAGSTMASAPSRRRGPLLALTSALAIAALCLLPTLAFAAPLDFEFLGAFGPDGTDTSGFPSGAGSMSVAIDHGEEVVYVLDGGANTLYKFDLEGNPVDFGGLSPNVSGNELSGLSVGGLRSERQVAVDSNTHIIYLTGKEVGGRATAVQAFHANGDPSNFTAGPGVGTNEISEFTEPNLRGVAVDANGDIYVSGVDNGNDINVYEATGEKVLDAIGTGLFSPANLAVDSDGTLYVARAGIYRLTPSTFPVTGSTKYVTTAMAASGEAFSLSVDPSTDRLYAVQAFRPEGVLAFRVAVFDQAGALLTSFGGPGEAGELHFADGIAVADIEEAGIEEPVARPFVSNNPEGGLSQVEIFQEELCICPPSIESTAVDSVTGDSAVLRGIVNPNNRDTEYWFEYGLQDCEVGPCTKVPLAGAAIGRGRLGVAVTQTITGLQSQTTHHYRVVAENEVGPPTEGPDKTFVTQGSGLGFALSDSRVWEMVSPAQKHGGVLYSSGQVIIQAATSGEGLVYGSRGSIVADPSSNRLPVSASVLAKRGAGGLWSSKDLSPPQSEASRFTDTPYKIFSPDLHRGELEATDDTPLSPESSERTPYLWTDQEPPLFTPLVNPSNVPPGTEFGPLKNSSNPVFVEGASRDLSHVVIRSDRAALVEGAEDGAIYLWSDGQLAAVSELPASEGGMVVPAALGSGPGSVRHAVSTDGSLIFWSTGGYQEGLGNALTGLFARDTVTEESGRLDLKQPGGSGAGEVRPAFNGASADGSVVFFTDSQQLTADASPEGRDLYRCEIGTVEGVPGCVELTDITAPPAGSGKSAEVIDQLPGLSEDGTRLYFVARGVLDEGQNDEGDVASAGEPNLYFWQEGESPRFIATLSDQDALVWGSFHNAPGYASRISAASSPDGRFFSFTSERSLTGYENRNSSGELTSEAYAFDAEAAEDQLTCVSCIPTGAAAVGEQIPETVKFLPQDPPRLWAGRWVSATLPFASQTEDTTGFSLYHPRTALDSGRVFFNSVDPLVPADSNGNWDVYEWQPVGVDGPLGQGLRQPDLLGQRRRRRRLPRRLALGQRRLLPHPRQALGARHRRGARRL